MSQKSVIGKHLIADFSGALFQTDVQQIEHALRAASEAAGATVLNVTVHQFPDSDGVTGVAMLAESHMSVHSWPEHDYMAFDIFMCGNTNPQTALAWLQEFFKPEKVATQIIDRATP